MTRLFLGCEYAQPDSKKLASLALVSLDGRHRFYAQMDPCATLSSALAMEMDYPPNAFGPAAEPTPELSKRLKAFLGQIREPLVLYVNERDGRCFCDLLHFEKGDHAADVDQTVRLAMISDPDVLQSTQRWFAERPTAVATRNGAEADAEALRWAAAALIR